MSWSSKRRTAYTAFTFLFLLSAAGAIFYLFFYQKPTCSDGKQNGDEAGIDCGGQCLVVCTFEAREPVVLWSRAFKVTDGVYNMLAYVENPNADVGIPTASYTFKVFDQKNILIAEREGETFISPNGISPIFEGGVVTGERIPALTFFELGKDIEWIKTGNSNTAFTVTGRTLSNEETFPRIDARLENNSTADFSDIEVIAVAFDLDGNAMASSKTFVNLLGKKSSQNIVFTWPTPFQSKSSRIEIIPRLPL